MSISFSISRAFVLEIGKTREMLDSSVFSSVISLSVSLFSVALSFSLFSSLISLFSCRISAFSSRGVGDSHFSFSSSLTSWMA